jgi:hypothetical protein
MVPLSFSGGNVHQAVYSDFRVKPVLMYAQGLKFLDHAL